MYDRIPPYSAFHSERTCSNCEHHGECWENFSGGPPPLFNLRDTWDAERYQMYIKTIYAQTCGAFISRHPEVRARQEANELAKKEHEGRTKANEEGWDY